MRATLESSSKRGSFDRISNRQESQNFEKSVENNCVQVRATLESSPNRESFDRISTRQESWNLKNWILEILYLTDKNSL